MDGVEPAVHLSTREYEKLRQSAQTHREELIIRLCGEAGLRAAEVAAVRPADVTGSGGAARTRYFVTVHGNDDSTRTAYLPSNVAHDFWQYVRSNGIADEETVVGVTGRRVQMIVNEISTRAADRTGMTTFEEVTPSTLRRYFARRLLVEHGVDARVVTAVGGWEGVDGVLQTLDTPTREEIAASFERIETQNERQSGRLPRVVKTFAAADESLVEAGTRDEIETLVCDRLADTVYRAAWVTEKDHRDRITVRTHAGERGDRFEGASDTGIARRALQTGGTLVAPDDPGPRGDSEGRGLLSAVPLSHGRSSYGALVVRAVSDDAFDEPERSALTAFGRRVAQAITATEQKRLLLGDTVLELTFRYSDGDAALLGISQEVGCTLVLEGMVPGEAGSLLCFVEMSDVSPERALAGANASDLTGDARLVQRRNDDCVLEIELGTDSPVAVLAERGATVTDLEITDGIATLVTEVPPSTDVRGLNEELKRHYPSVELHSKQEQSPTMSPSDVEESLEERLTEKQRAVLEGAYRAGYFEWPRGSTAEDLADSMGVSSPTLHNHLRRAQQKLLEAVLDEESMRRDPQLN
ncbi:MAG: bacterio-opsin activator domain-containing protein [Halovenus sp.]